MPYRYSNLGAYHPSIMLLALGTIMFVLHTFVLCGTYAAPPIATLDFANATGVRAGGVNKFLGIPYARPP